MDEPVREKGRGLLSTHPHEPGALLVQALVLLLAPHADKSGSGWSGSKEVLSEVVVDVNVGVVGVDAVVDVVLLASHADEPGGSLEAVDVVAVLLEGKKSINDFSRKLQRQPNDKTEEYYLITPLDARNRISELPL